MNKVVTLAGLASLLAAGTAPAQTSVRLSLEFGVPRPHVAGVIIVGRPHVRPVYRPCFHRPCGYDRYHARHRFYRSAPFGHRHPRRLIIVDRHRHRRFDRDRHDDRD